MSRQFRQQFEKKRTINARGWAGGSASLGSEERRRRRRAKLRSSPGRGSCCATRTTMGWRGDKNPGESSNTGRIMAYRSRGPKGEGAFRGGRPLDQQTVRCPSRHQPRRLASRKARCVNFPRLRGSRAVLAPPIWTAGRATRHGELGALLGAPPGRVESRSRGTAGLGRGNV